MSRSEGYNSPKGAANNAAQKQQKAMGSPHAKRAIQPDTKPVQPITSKPTEEGNT